jgi:hypothetical protein
MIEWKARRLHTVSAQLSPLYNKVSVPFRKCTLYPWKAWTVGNGLESSSSIYVVSALEPLAGDERSLIVPRKDLFV